MHDCNVNTQVSLPTEQLQALVTLKGLLFLVHSLDVPSQMLYLTELLQALVTLMWLFFVMHNLDVQTQVILFAELHGALVTLIWLFFAVLTSYVFVKVTSVCKCQFTVIYFTGDNLLVGFH